MTTTQGVVERATSELSKRINGLTLRKNVSPTPSTNNNNSKNVVSSKINALEKISTNSSSNLNHHSLVMVRSPPCSPKKSPRHQSSKVMAIKSNFVSKSTTRSSAATFSTWRELLTDEKMMTKLFSYFAPVERVNLSRVCIRWKEHLYRYQKYWANLSLCVHYKEFRYFTSNEKTRFFNSFVRRGFRALCISETTDEDSNDLINRLSPNNNKQVQSLIIKWSPISDKGLQLLIENMPALYELELIGCNELTDGGLWVCLAPRIVSLKMADCINIADEAVGAVAQLLPSLKEFSLQAYHVTDTAFGFFSPKHGMTLSVLKLHSCWEITNSGVVNIVHTLPNLTILGLSGCNKISDDGVEIITENLRKLKSLDLSWCPRITDMSLEYIACDLTGLQQLTLDRCINITDVGVGYLSTMPSLQTLYLRWCTQIRDNGIQHLCTMRSLKVLSLAGCPQLTANGLFNLVKMKQLQEIEFTNCPGTTKELFRCLREQLPKCTIVE